MVTKATAKTAKPLAYNTSMTDNELQFFYT